jgi:CDP-4-dehydro-6-deoxyglucose reductase
VQLLNGKAFKCKDGQSILDAALEARILLDHSCKTGRCGSCRIRINGGDTQTLLQEDALTSAEIGDGWILSCARTPVGDLEIDAEDLSDFPVQKPQIFPCRISELQELSSDVMRVMLRLPPSALFSYRAGQHIDVIAPGGIRRSYSLASGALSSGEIELHVRKVVGGKMSQYWFEQAKHSDLLRINGPKGTFFLRNMDGRDLIFLATGTGIAPIKAILEDMAINQALVRPRSIKLYWGARRMEDLYWSPAISSPNFEFNPTLSKADSSWSGSRAYVQDLAISGLEDISSLSVYACGSSTMIKSALSQFLAVGLTSDHFIFDAFVPSS